MNLNAYDIVEEKSMGTYVDPEYKRLYSDSIKFRHYYYFFEKYNPQTRSKDYYIYLSNGDIDNAVKHSTSLTKSNEVRIDLKPIWNKNITLRLIDSITKINIELIAEDDDGVMYYIDI